jgi:hypothetical protein
MSDHAGPPGSSLLQGPPSGALTALASLLFDIAREAAVTKCNSAPAEVAPESGSGARSRTETLPEGESR